MVHTSGVDVTLEAFLCAGAGGDRAARCAGAGAGRSAAAAARGGRRRAAVHGGDGAPAALRAQHLPRLHVRGRLSMQSSRARLPSAAQCARTCILCYMI